MWQELIDQKEKWIGGKLINRGTFYDRAEPKTEGLPAKTEIKDFTLHDGCFGVIGKDFSLFGDISNLWISAEHVDKGLVIAGDSGQVFTIVKPE